MGNEFLQIFKERRNQRRQDNSEKAINILESL